jgi:SAM-dependent methyltransferase
MNRDDLIRAQFTVGGLGLEVGPGYNPLFPKSRGHAVETIDHTDQAGLQAKYASHPAVDCSRIEPVDYVSNGRPMREVIGLPQRYSWIFASNVLEHVPDFIGFLNDCAWLLKPDGVLVLSVPDKRFCFDLFLGITTAGMTIQAHMERRTRPSPGAIFDYNAYSVKREEHIVWPRGYAGEVSTVHNLAYAQDRLREATFSDAYIDAHVWRFTPSSFRLLVSDLNAMGFISLREVTLVPIPAFEFCAVLSQSRSDGSPDRNGLVQATLRELKAPP